ncbi:hypothetical protein LJC41_08640 [Desulfosarcina sp. OttesenSCG-928-G17]|nr:hypothetical protein [Desulfosarcina sp. OttesenSCG-928-G17]
MNRRTPQRSPFVTAVAWVLIIFSGFFILMTLLQIILMYVLSNTALLSELMPLDVPVRNTFIYIALWIMVVVFSLVAVTSLVSAIGLLKQKNWARLVVMASMACGAVLGFFLFIIHLVMIVVMQKDFMSSPDIPGVGLLLTSATLAGIFFSFGLTVACGWAAKRLMSGEIIAGFHRPNPFLQKNPHEMGGAFRLDNTHFTKK